ncbi:MAG: nitroreductase family protein [Anaerolineaceae bacterium]
MNETIQNILNRRSIRKYSPKQVEENKLKLILECAQYAPSAQNRQPWHFTMITKRSMLDKITAANRKVMLKSEVERLRERAQQPDFDSFQGAPVAILVSGEDQARYTMSDCANATENMAIAAQSLGLGCCYLGSFKIAFEAGEAGELLEELGVPKGFSPLFALALGYQDEVLEERAPRRENTITII